jgi:hypothetical protein
MLLLLLLLLQSITPVLKQYATLSIQIVNSEHKLTICVIPLYYASQSKLLQYTPLYSVSACLNAQTCSANVQARTPSKFRP